MPRLNAIPGLPPEAIEQLNSCGVESVEMLTGIPPAEIHRVLELTAWKKGRLNRAPTLDMVHQWVELARRVPVTAGGGGDSSGPVPPSPASSVALEADDDIPEAIVMPRSALPNRNFNIPPSQRARLDSAGPPVPAAAYVPLAAAPTHAQAAAPAPAPRAASGPPTSPFPAAAPAAIHTPESAENAASRFNTFEDYQSGNVRIAPLNRYSIDAPPDPLESRIPERVNANEELPRRVRRGVVHPNPGLVVFGAVVSLLWRLAVAAAIVGVPWLLFTVPRPSEYAREILIATGILTVLGVAQLIVIGKVRCRICTCHLFHSRNTVKNRKAHSIPGLGKTASLSLHLLIFQWFRCMYCGTAIKLWASKNDRAS